MTRGAADSTRFHMHTTGPRPFIAICIPTFGMVHIFFTARLLNLRIPMNRVVRYEYCVGEEIGLARNELVAGALEADGTDARCSHVFFLDDDVLFHPEVLNQLMSHQLPIVSGLYYAKTTVPTPLVLHGEYEGVHREWKPGELVQCYAHGMGLTLIEADVFRRLRDETDLGVDAHGSPNWFSTTRDLGIVRADGTQAVYNQTEDVAFLRRAAALGYAPTVDTGPNAFGWHIDTKARPLRGYPQQQWQEFASQGTITWETAHGAVTWAEPAA